jgi:hypothetical protein
MTRDWRRNTEFVPRFIGWTRSAWGGHNRSAEQKASTARCLFIFAAL